MSFFCKVYVDKEVVYEGDLSEVPDKYRSNMQETLSDWAASLDRKGLNELVYSLFVWYNKKSKQCENCGAWAEDEKACPRCGGKLKEQFLYERNKKLELLLTCIGMISRIEVSG